MTILLVTVSFSFVAFCIWLSVRIVNRREWWAKRLAAVLLVSPVLYVVSFGPACWLLRGNRENAPRLYWPVGWVLMYGHPAFRPPILWYAMLGISDGHRVELAASHDGRLLLFIEKGKPSFLATWGLPPD